MKILSICGGLETGLLALQELGIPVEEYHTFEIYAPAIELSKKHFPFIVHHGDVIGADFSQFRKLTPIEYERLQTLPDNFTSGYNDNVRRSLCGNGWTKEVIKHIFKGLIITNTSKGE